MYSRRPAARQTEEEKDEVYRQYMDTAISQTYYGVCLNKCIKGFTSDLAGEEKKCLVKCVDRAHDYLVMSIKYTSPFHQDNLTKRIMTPSDTITIINN